MRKLRSHLFGIDSGSLVLFSDFLDDGEMWTGDGERILRRYVEFSEAYANPPVVNVTMSMWDIDGATNQRVDIAAADITAEGFTIVFQTWGDTRVARVRADWTAYGEAHDEEGWDLY